MSQEILDSMVERAQESVSNLLDLLEHLGIKSANADHMDEWAGRLGGNHQDSYIEPFTARCYRVR